MWKRRTTSSCERVHEMHRQHCPVYRSIRAAIDITTTLELLTE